MDAYDPLLPNGEQSPFNPLAPPPERGPSPKLTTTLSHAQSTRHQAPTPEPPPPPPPSLGSADYDVYPPSATSSSNCMNAPPSGFSSVNQSLGQTIKTHIQQAYANRHHHCEHSDELYRDIWTYYGPGETKEAPTVAGKKMYLRCNHDNCMRIDWMALEGLQNHILMGHGIPKCIINSLELAFKKYGVPVQDIEDHEKKHGLGSAGTMAGKIKYPSSRKKYQPSRKKYSRCE